MQPDDSLQGGTPAGGATALIVSLGIATKPVNLLVIEVAVAASVGQAIVTNRLAGLAGWQVNSFKADVILTNHRTNPKVRRVSRHFHNWANNSARRTHPNHPSRKAGQVR
jgi:hypothetical protein